MDISKAVYVHERRYEFDGLHYATLMINYNDASILGRRRIDSSSLHPEKGSLFSPLYDILFIFCLFPFLYEHIERIANVAY